MASINNVILIARLVADPDIRITPSGKVVANFSVATTEQLENKDGCKEENIEWPRIVADGRLAEICGEYLRKGSQVYIEGKLQPRKLDDKGWNIRYVTEIVVQTIVIKLSR